ncbi:MAG: flagellar basal-body MS-ring/collar protein FliF, partial [Alphaproteobacteria bacterium]
VVNRLEALGVTVEVDPTGSAVLAPKGDIARLRMQLAQDGLPAGGGMGYELLDKSNGLGATSFEQQMTRLRALEGELARSIRTLGPVKQARVHLVLPKRELFSREQQEPTASIVVAVRGAALNSGQVAAIRHLVASAVPKLRADRVSIVDTSGNLLASGESLDPSGAATAAAGGGVQDRRAEIEGRLGDAIERLLERAVGAGRVRAEVSADLDFDRITTNSEQFDPEGQVLRSSQLVTEENASSEGGKGGRVSVDRNLPNADETQGGGDAAAGSSSNRTEEINNFEISKTVRTHIRESGLIRRLSVAVMVDAEGA